MLIWKQAGDVNCHLATWLPGYTDFSGFSWQLTRAWASTGWSSWIWPASWSHQETQRLLSCSILMLPQISHSARLESRAIWGLQINVGTPAQLGPSCLKPYPWGASVGMFWIWTHHRAEQSRAEGLMKSSFSEHAPSMPRQLPKTTVPLGRACGSIAEKTSVKNIGSIAPLTNLKGAAFPFSWPRLSSGYAIGQKEKCLWTARAVGVTV